mgnify:CR=1 FL=1
MAGGMALIPLEDNFTDVIGKAQRGWKITDADLCARAEVTAEDLAVVAVDPGLGKHRRRLEDEDVAVDDPNGLERRDPSIVVGTGKGVTKFAFGGLPQGKVTVRAGHGKGWRFEKGCSQAIWKPESEVFFVKGV